MRDCAVARVRVIDLPGRADESAAQIDAAGWIGAARSGSGVGIPASIRDGKRAADLFTVGGTEVVAEEKQPVFLNRAADRAAKVVV